MNEWTNEWTNQQRHNYCLIENACVGRKKSPFRLFRLVKYFRYLWLYFILFIFLFCLSECIEFANYCKNNNSNMENKNETDGGLDALRLLYNEFFPLQWTQLWCSNHSLKNPNLKLSIDPKQNWLSSIFISGSNITSSFFFYFFL